MTAAAQPAMSYSIKTDENGGKYVEIDTDQHLFDNAPKKSYAAIAKRVLLDRFAGQTLPLGESDLVRLEARQAGEYAYPHTLLDTRSAEYNAKMRASTELANLLETAEYSHWAKDAKNHKEATLGFDYYKTKFVLDGHSFEGLVNIANSENGRIFYDITKIEEIPTIRKKPATRMAQSASASSESQPANSISNSGEDVNAKFSLSLEENLTDAAGQDIITDEERGAILQYKSSESFKINPKLRDGLELSEQEKQFVENLDNGLRKLPKYEGRVYRRLSFDMEGRTKMDAFLAEHQTDALVDYLAFTSASTEMDGYSLNGDLTVMMVIDGHNGRNVDGYGNNFEREVIFPRGTVIHVESVETDANGNSIIYATEVVNNGGKAEDVGARAVSVGTGSALHTEERGETVQQVQEEKRGDVRGVSEGDTARGSDKRLPGVRAEGVDERFSLSGQKGRSGEVEYLRELNDKQRMDILR